MEAPLVRYVSAADGVSIAYWKLGSGPPLVSLPPLPHSHIGMEWEFPEIRRGFELAAGTRTMVRYDGRGTGLSQRGVDDFSFEAMISDLDAVVSALDADKVALLGVINTAGVAIEYSVRYPGRVSELVLWCPVVDGSVHRANPQLDAARKVMVTDWDMFSLTVAHVLVGWEESGLARRYAEMVRAGITQEDIQALVPELHKINVWDQLPRITCPTLVLHRPGMKLVPPGTIEKVVASIPNAQLALFDGASTAPYVGDWRSIVRTIADFLGGPAAAAGGRVGGRALRLLHMKADALTPREGEVVQLIVRGLTNREIAEELFLAEKTVENHIGRILVKLDLRSRTQVAAYAVEHGLTSKSA